MDEQIASLLTEFARALHRQSMYPANHPALSGSAAAVADLVADVLGDRAELAIQVGRSQLAVDGALTDEDNPALSSLAGQLHGHAVAILSISREVQADEIDELLRALTLDPLADETSPLAGQSWSHVRITFVHYDQLALDAEGGGRLPSGELGGVWLALANSALAGEEVGPDDATDAVRLAHDIEARSSDKAYAKNVVTHLLEVEQVIESAPGESTELRELASDLVTRLDAGALRGLLDRGTSVEERRQLLAKAPGSLHAGAVVKLMREIAQLEDCEIPHAVWLMLSKLARYADQGDGEQRAGASRLIQEKVLELLDDWNVSTYTPTDYAEVLEAMSVDASDRATSGSGRSRARVAPTRTLQMGIEIGRPTRSVLDGFEEMVGEGAIGEILDLLKVAPSDNPAVVELRQRIKEPHIFGLLFEAESPDFELIDRMIALLGLGAVDPMLDAITNSDSRAVRSQLFRRLVGFGAEIAPMVATRLDDGRWYVRRNMLSLLDELGGMPPGSSAAVYLEDEVEAVRLMGIKLLLREADQRDRAVVAALDSNDSRTVILGLVSARDDCPDSQVPRIVELALDTRRSREIRVYATRALAGVRREEAIEALLQLARQKRGLAFWRQTELLSAVAVEARQILQSSWADDPRARSVLGRPGRAKQRRSKSR
jgi:alkylhydroperoxidase/carboxymuconolactone decarboxylase family protein YurZ